MRLAYPLGFYYIDRHNRHFFSMGIGKNLPVDFLFSLAARIVTKKKKKKKKLCQRISNSWSMITLVMFSINGEKYKLRSNTREA